MNSTSNRRISLVVRHPIQRNYLRIVLWAMMLPMIVSTGCVYFIIWQTVAHELAIPELIAEALFPAIRQVNFILLIGLPIVCIVIFFFALKVSNSFAGPIYRIEKELDEIIKTKQFKKNIRIRPTDQVHSLVSKINEALHTASRLSKNS